MWLFFKLYYTQIYTIRRYQSDGINQTVSIRRYQSDGIDGFAQMYTMNYFSKTFIEPDNLHLS